MLSSLTSSFIASLIFATGPVAIAAEPKSESEERQFSPIVLETRLDPAQFFDQLVHRYRALTAYSDRTRIIQITRDHDQEKLKRTETEISSDFSDGKLMVESAASQLRSHLGLNIPIRQTEEISELSSKYRLWLLPHLSLKFSEKPLEEFREGVSEGFTATDAAEVTVDDKPMVHLELTSGDGLSGDYNARFDLYIDPESMLIERIEGRQRLPDGGDSETTFQITPRSADQVRPEDYPRPVMTTPEHDGTAQPANEGGTNGTIMPPCMPPCTSLGTPAAQSPKTSVPG